MPLTSRFIYMKTAAIISIGSEIMRGKIDDTNSTYLSKWLTGLGISVDYRLSTKDVIKDIVEAIKYVSACDLIILTGGLGPTPDDLTREALAEYLNKKLIFQNDEYQKIVSLFKKMNRPFPESNKKQADLIEGAEFLCNNNGTAPGMFYKTDEKIFVLLPGPPKENQPMIQEQLSLKLKQHHFVGKDFNTKIYRIYNVGESAIADMFTSFKDDVSIGYYATVGGWCEIHINENATRSRQIEKILTDNKIFFTDDKDISLMVLEKLETQNKTISFAESITGGNISAEFVKNPGASKVFEGSIVSYSNEIKKSVLGVKQETLDTHGAVSEETVKEMCYGLKKNMNTNICIAVSGIAGPQGGSEQKPVGTVWFGFLFGENFYSKKELFPGIRSRIMSRVTNTVFVEILKNL